jgi:uncharacterized protein
MGGWAVRARWLPVLVWAVLAASTARAGVNYPPRPAAGEFFLDEAGMIAEGDRARVRELGAALLKDKGFPLVVVTIHSMAEHGGAGMTIETFARGLFDTWGIGRPEQNYGVLLLVSQQDRKARIELGAAWGRDHDAVCLDIMNDLIIPDFKAERFSEGIRAGAEALDKMARGEEIPSRPLTQRAGDSARSAWGAIKHNAMIALVLPLVLISSIYNRIRYGVWYNPNSSSSSSGGSWGGGGGFGGGFSGGGGASGSW